jgi:hypothetical protein
MVPFFFLSKKEIKHKETGCLLKSASFKVIELDFLTYLSIVTKAWSFMEEVKVSMHIQFTSNVAHDHFFQCTTFPCYPFASLLSPCLLPYDAASTPRIFVNVQNRKCTQTSLNCTTHKIFFPTCLHFPKKDSNKRVTSVLLRRCNLSQAISE